MNHWTPTDPEIQTIEDFVQYLIDDELTVFAACDLQALNKSTNRPIKEIRAGLEEWGFVLAGRAKEKRIRGVQSWDNNRWEGNPCGGGSGWEQIAGSAGREG